jgi:hypothetical protein
MEITIKLITMYYYFINEFIDEKKLMRLTGTMYYNGKKFEETIFDYGDYIDEKKYDKPFKIIIDESDSAYKKRIPNDKVPLTVVNIGPMLLVSPKIETVFKKVKVSNVQFFNVDIKASDFELSNYKLMNIVGKCDCIDRDKSELLLRKNGDILHIEKLVLNEKKINTELELFRIGETYTPPLIHERLIKAIQKEQLTGIAYKALDDV